MAKVRKLKAPERVETPTAQPWTVVVGVGLLCLALFLAPLIAGALKPTQALAVQALVLCASILWVMRAAGEDRLALPSTTVLVGAGALLAFACASAWTSVSRYQSVRELLNLLSYVMVFLMAVGSSKDVKRYGPLLISLGASAVIVGGMAMVEYTGSWLSGNTGWRTFATFFNPDFLAGFVCVVAPVFLSACLWGRSRTVAIVSGVLTVLTLATLVVTGSRVGFLACAVGLALTLAVGIVRRAFGRDQIVRLVIVVALSAAVFKVAGTPLAARVMDRQVVESQTHSGGFRKYTWAGTVTMLRKHPVLGVGIGGFEGAYPRYAITGYTRLAHNSYLQLASEAGAPAVLCLVLVLAASGLGALVVAGRSRDGRLGETPSWLPEPEILVAGLLGGALASMARNLVDSDWYVTGIGIPFWATLGLAVGMTCRERALSPRARRSTTTIAAAVLAGALLVTASLSRSESSLASGISLARQGSYDSAVSAFRDSIASWSTNAEAHRRLGVLLTWRYTAGGRDSAALNDALAELRTAAKLEPSSAKSFNQLGKTLAAAGRDSEAVGAFERARDCDPNSPEILLRLAECYERLGRGADAMAVYRRMVSVEESPYETVRAVPEIVEPRYAFARAAIGREAERLGQSETALSNYRLALERIGRYQDSMKGMGGILDLGVGRDREIEDRISDLKADLEARVTRLNGER